MKSKQESRERTVNTQQTHSHRLSGHRVHISECSYLRLYTPVTRYTHAEYLRHAEVSHCSKSQNNTKLPMPEMRAHPPPVRPRPRSLPRLVEPSLWAAWPWARETQAAPKG